MGNSSFKLFILLLFLPFILVSQNIKGVVLDSKTSAPLVGASVYFDNTTIGVITDLDGKFSFNIDKEINSPLIISFLGYKTNSISKVENNKTYEVLLEEDINVLNEVLIVSKDEWTRDYKMKQFKAQFLGSSKLSETCKILNESLIRLRFNKKENKLIATSKQPIIIINEALGYEIAYDLQNFEINYLSYNYKINHEEKTNYKMISVFYSGTTFYKNLTSQSSKKEIKNREKAYKGSIIHFMRCIADGKLKEEKFKIFKGSFVVKPETQIFTKTDDSLDIVKVKIPIKLNILYKGRQSSIESKVDTFFIDTYGNYSPINYVIFTGDMGNQRIAEMLPINYGL